MGGVLVEPGVDVVLGGAIEGVGDIVEEHGKRHACSSGSVLVEKLYGYGFLSSSVGVGSIGSGGWKGKGRMPGIVGL